MMKTRIISGAVMIAGLAAVLVAGNFFPIIITLVLAAVNVIASFELLHNAAGIKSKLSLIGAAVYSALAIIVLSGLGLSYFTILSVFYGIYAAVITLANHKDFSIKEIAVTMSMPIIVSFAFGCLESTLNGSNGIYYLLLLLNFSSICDMGAYFVGSSIGKHKLCPEISPKKTVEGAIGGIASSIIVSLILVLCFGMAQKLIVTLLLTIPLCVLGMIGDLFASAIKRSVGIKDYGALIPGHGGVLDRVDSILMLAPVVYILMGAQVL